MKTTQDFEQGKNAMAPPFVKMNRAQFAAAVANHAWSGKKTEIHVHHTWRPNHAQYNGVGSINAMYAYHTKTKKWSDIAQHVSIAPDGAIWTGRPWNASPASAAGHNHSGVFMFETIGDFDLGKDPLTGEQLESVLFVVATLQIKFGLPDSSSIRFHNEMSAKTCPGESVDQIAFVKQVKAMREKIASGQLDPVSPFAGLYSDRLRNAIEGDVDAMPSASSSDEHDDGPELEAFMAAQHANPFEALHDAGSISTLSRGRSAQGKVLATVRTLAQPSGDPEADEQALFEELGRRVLLIEADPAFSADTSVSFGPSASGFSDRFAELGRRIFARLEREFHALLCGVEPTDASDRAKLRDAFGIGGDAAVAAIVAVLTGGLGVAPAIAAVVAALLVKRVLRPTYAETCAFWGESLQQR